MGGCWDALVIEQWDACRTKELWVGAEDAEQDEKGEGADEVMAADFESFSPFGFCFSVLSTPSSVLLLNT